MSVFEYIILAFALSIPSMVIVRDCALKSPIRLIRGLIVSLILGAEHALLLLLGVYLGNLLRLDIPDYDNLIYLGLLVVVAIRMFFPAFRKKDRVRISYNIASWSTVFFLGIATGINIFIVGLGIGFRVELLHEVCRAAIPMIVLGFLLSYFGLMLGRRKKEMRERRWQLLAVLFLLIFAIKGAFFGE